MIQKLQRRYLPENFEVNTWEDIGPYFDALQKAPIASKHDLENWLNQLSELEAVISEDACWRQIRMTCDTANTELQQRFEYFCTHIQPQVQVYADELNKKLMASPFVKELDTATYFTMLRNIEKNITLFRAENVAIQSELSVLQQQYGAIAGQMTVEVDGQIFTLQQAAKFLENPNREKREEVYKKIYERRLQNAPELNDLYTQLIQKRHQVAINAGYSHYTPYKFVEMGRFDYTPADCAKFHEGVKQHVLPLVNHIYAEKKKELQLDVLKPWDLEAIPADKKPLKPFTNTDDLLGKTKTCLQNLDPFFADCLQTMQQMGRFDLESRTGKAPGGYNCPLAETGAPFIFMNAAGTMDDVVTMVHEGGHAVHSFLAHPLALTAFKEYPTEMAEVASMAMELFSMQHWDVFFTNKTELLQAKLHQLERVITIFPWIAIIDKFQHWVYAHPSHSVEERMATWQQIRAEFASSELDTTGLENLLAHSWQRQLHLFEVPFYYIEYGIAQLGAIAMWRQFQQNGERALQHYKQALALGGTKTLPELYTAAGIEFSFEPGYVAELMQFVWVETEKLQREAATS
ncbi:MAG: M3 family oligoendopeptidase [Bacteroidetes bacterium]|nr:MAG: M3 family oligoendopeptidase [Bacteroidota bacterium]TAF98239.1 MAG: M3 family oligoendopeptidase [Bacteroidota bacterium]